MNLVESAKHQLLHRVMKLCVFVVFQGMTLTALTPMRTMLTPAGLKKQKTLPPPNQRTLAAPTQEVATAPTIGFSNTWPTETGTAPGGSYPNWPQMQPQQVQAAHVP
jgi:hypothetical protein